MKIKKIIGFLSPVGKNKDNISLNDIFGQEINNDSKLFDLLEEVFNKSEKECNIMIRFIALEDNQDNDIRDHIINISNNFCIDSCKPLVRNLSYLTDNTIKEGLLFYVLAEKENNSRLFIARFPGEIGITVTETNGVQRFDVTEDIFLKNSRRYKAVYYDSKDQHWIGYAVDKQVNDRSGKIKEISEYWIKDFLKSELKITSKRGSRLLAKAIRKTITETKSEDNKQELIGISTTIKNLNNVKLSIKDILNSLNLSYGTKQEVMGKISDSKINNIPFTLDIKEFNDNFNYLVKILHTGAIVIGPAKDFDEIWDQEEIGNGEHQYTTTGKAIKQKISNSRL